MLTDANCAAPANTMIDMAIAATAPISGSARTPNDVPMAKVGSTSGSPARMPSDSVDLSLVVVATSATIPAIAFWGYHAPMSAEPGDRAPAPGELRLVQRFVNTNDLEGGPELIPDAAALREWLATAGLLEPSAPVSLDDHARAIALREAIRALASAHAGLPHDPGAGEVVDEAARRAPCDPSSATPPRASSPAPPAWTPRSAASSPPSTRRSPRARGRG